METSATSQRKHRIGVFGGGSWGTALANALGGTGHDVTIWALEPEVVSGINERHRNPLFLKDTLLEPSVQASSDMADVVEGAELLLFVIPAQFVRPKLRELRDRLSPDAPLVICSKGIEQKTLCTMEEVFKQELPERLHHLVSVLSGPSFAAEVASGLPTSVTVAARDLEVARRVQKMVAARHFRVYTTDDVVGVEIGGALKNVMAIVVGGCDALGLGANTRAALITRGLAEITRIAVRLGGRAETLLGLSGVGDLVLTCTGDLSRNRNVGKLLAKGHTMDEVRGQMQAVAEGVPTTESAYQLAQKHGIDAPIIEVVYRVIYDGWSVPDAIKALQDRTPKDEWRL